MTLVELLITVVILGAIGGAVGLATGLVTRTRQDIGADLTSTRYAQTLALWFPADVQSADPAGAFVTDPSDTGGCGSALPGLNRLRIGLNPGNGGPAIASYRVAGTSSPYQLVRATCLDATSDPVVRTMVDNIADPSDVSLTLLPVATIPPSRAEFVVTTSENGVALSFTVTGTLRASSPTSTLP